MAFTVGTGYEVRQISFPRGTNTAPSYIEWATWSGLTGLAVGNEIIKTYNTSSDLGLAAYGYGVSTTSLGLPNGEYIKYAKAPLGDIS
ncbi:hypothetical protein FACS1894176_04640 [Bacteroidia bacterium]|nr:hypothetical protein FACS1894176_04640 [Bacteroidia bacterium]